MGYVVTAPYVTVQTMTTHGKRVIGLHTGAPVPDDAPESWVKGHLEAKMIAEVTDPSEVGASPLTPLEMLEAREAGRSPGEEVFERVAEGEKAYNRRAAAQKAAETRRAKEQGEGQGSGQADAPVVSPPVSAPAAGGPVAPKDAPKAEGK